jgi:hypothetical protein
MQFSFYKKEGNEKNRLAAATKAKGQGDTIFR